MHTSGECSGDMLYLYRLTQAFASRITILMIWLKFNLKIKTVLAPLQNHTTKTIISMFSPFFSAFFNLKSLSVFQRLSHVVVVFSSHGVAFIVNHNHLSNTTQVLLMPLLHQR